MHALRTRKASGRTNPAMLASPDQCQPRGSRKRHLYSIISSDCEMLARPSVAPKLDLGPPAERNLEHLLRWKRLGRTAELASMQSLTEALNDLPQTTCVLFEHASKFVRRPTFFARFHAGGVSSLGSLSDSLTAPKEELDLGQSCAAAGFPPRVISGGRRASGPAHVSFRPQ